MNDSAVRAERFGLPASPSGSYVWEVPNKPVSVRMSLEMVERLEREVVESFRSLSSRGSEIGGLLLGSIESGNPARVAIEAYEPVACDYARGPLYQFSEADAERFDRAAEARNGAGGLRVVGFFRSHTRKALSLDAEDLAFFSGHFRDPHQIVLLIRPYASKPSTAGIFIRENGTVHSEASYQEFPFRRSELERQPPQDRKASAEKALEKAGAGEPAGAAPEPPQAKPPVRAQIVPIASRREISMPPPPPPERPAREAESEEEAPRLSRPAEKPVPPEPAPSLFAKAPAPAVNKLPAPSEEPEREAFPLADLVLPPLERPRRNKMVWITAGCAGALLLLSGALLYPGFGHKPRRAAAVPGQDAAALSLRVERSSGELLLTWNRDSDAIRNAVRGVLTISDGDQHENVNLDLTQLRNGSVVYSPTSSDVSFQLSIVGPNSSQTNSESVRVLKTRPSPMSDNAPPAQSRPGPAPPRGETNTAGAPAVAPAPAPPASQVAEAKPASTLREFHAESLSQRLRPVRPTDLPEAPGLVAVAPVAMPLPGISPTPGAPVAPQSSALPASAPAPKIGGQLQQAQLVSSRPPEYPQVAKQAHVQGVVVVSATVGVDGKVKAASAVSGPPLLQKAAVDAVRQWVYKPTTLNGAPMESETRVEVRFTADR